MANISEVSEFTADVYQLEITDPLEGGAGGVMNFQAQSLANRTLWLKDENTLRDNEITALEVLANKYFPKKRGWATGIDPGETTGSKTVSGDIGACVVTSSESGTDFNSTTYTVTMGGGAMPSINYMVEIDVESMGTITFDNDVFKPVFKKISVNQFFVSVQAQALGSQNLKLHFKVYSLD